MGDSTPASVDTDSTFKLLPGSIVETIDQGLRTIVQYSTEFKMHILQLEPMAGHLGLT
jgi:hypothetical protein